MTLHRRRRAAIDHVRGWFVGLIASVMVFSVPQTTFGQGLEAQLSQRAVGRYLGKDVQVALAYTAEDGLHGWIEYDGRDMTCRLKPQGFDYVGTFESEGKSFPMLLRLPEEGPVLFLTGQTQDQMDQQIAELERVRHLPPLSGTWEAPPFKLVITKTEQGYGGTLSAGGEPLPIQGKDDGFSGFVGSYQENGTDKPMTVRMYAHGIRVRAGQVDVELTGGNVQMNKLAEEHFVLVDQWAILARMLELSRPPEAVAEGLDAMERSTEYLSAGDTAQAVSHMTRANKVIRDSLVAVRRESTASQESRTSYEDLLADWERHKSKLTLPEDYITPGTDAAADALALHKDGQYTQAKAKYDEAADALVGLFKQYKDTWGKSEAAKQAESAYNAAIESLNFPPDTEAIQRIKSKLNDAYALNNNGDPQASGELYNEASADYRDLLDPLKSLDAKRVAAQTAYDELVETYARVQPSWANTWKDHCFSNIWDKDVDALTQQLAEAAAIAGEGKAAEAVEAYESTLSASNGLLATIRGVTRYLIDFKYIDKSCEEIHKKRDWQAKAAYSEIARSFYENNKGEYIRKPSLGMGDLNAVLRGDIVATSHTYVHPEVMSYIYKVFHTKMLARYPGLNSPILDAGGPTWGDLVEGIVTENEKLGPAATAWATQLYNYEVYEARQPGGAIYTPGSHIPRLIVFEDTAEIAKSRDLYLATARFYKLGSHWNEVGNKVFAAKKNDASQRAFYRDVYNKTRAKYASGYQRCVENAEKLGSQGE